MSEISYKGKILISNSSIVTDDFNKSVVFIVDHDSSGAFGLVVNKKSMPPAGPLPANEIKLINCWLKDGAKQN